MAEDPDEDVELLQEFLTEAEEKIGDLDLAFIELEKHPSDREIVERIFRGIHTIKGNSGFLGFHRLEAVAHAGENVLADVRAGKLDVTPQLVSLLLQCADAIREIVSRLRETGAEGTTAFDDLLARLGAARASETPKAEDRAPSTPEREPPSAATAPTNGPATERQAAPSAALGDATIRVSVRLIEELMNQVGELVLCRNQILQHVAVRDDEALEAATQELDHLTSRLQENMMKTRLQPIGNAFNKFPRIVRDLALATGKEIEVELEGQATEVDKTLLEAITDPLTHVIRNAADHGIEPPQEREVAGKARQGKVRLKAHHEGGQVVVTIADDGRGMSPDKLLAKAVERGLVPASEVARWSKRQALNLIFAPGFSTADKVTNISGRGVGMDVVKRNIERVNGRIDIESEVGIGTTFRLQIPLTLAIIPALIVRIDDDRFAIPQVNLVELVFLEGEDVSSTLRNIKSARVMRLRDQLVPVVSLRSLLRLPPREDEPDTLFIVVVRFGAQMLGLIVDEGLDSEEIVVKPLVSHVKRIGCYAGTTIMGDGSVALILDVAGLMRMCDLTDERSAADGVRELRRDVQSLLLFSAGGNQLLGIPLILISRIENLAGDDVVAVGDREGLRCCDRLVPIVHLHDYLDVGRPSKRETVTALLFELGEKAAAIVVDEIYDSLELDGCIDTKSFVRDGVLGSFLLDGRSVLVVDVYRILEQADPQWFRREKMPERTSPPRILLVDDSPFFTNLVRSYLEGAGYEVTSAADGRQGLAQLQGKSFDLVVCDLEMPVMDGFTMTATVRTDQRWDKLPIIALTSLDSERDRAQAARSGFDAYRVKLNREELLDEIDALLERGRSGPMGQVAS